MPFQLSPGVNVSEVDLTTVVPAVATTDAAIAGLFKWGPAGKAMMVGNEDQLLKEYGRPDNDNFETWFSAANFLSYANRLHVSRAHHSTGVDVQLQGYGENSGNNIIIYSDTETTVEVGFGVAESAQVSSGTKVTAVDASGLTQTVTLANIDDSVNEFQAVPVFVNGERVQLDDGGSGEPLPAPLADSTDYYVVSTDVNSFQLSLSAGGTPIELLDSGNTDVNFTRQADTRITVDTPLTTGGTYYNEFFDIKYSFNAIANTSVVGQDSNLSSHIVKNKDEIDAAKANFDSNVQYVAKYPGQLGNSLSVSVCDSAAAYSSDVTVEAVVPLQTTELNMTIGTKVATLTTSSSDNLDITTTTDQFSAGDLLRFGNTEIGFQYLEVLSVTAPATVGANLESTITFADSLNLSEDVAIKDGTVIKRFWKHYALVQKAPGQSSFVESQGNTAATDEIHLVVTDEDGKITGVPKTVLEVFQGLSRATDGKGLDGNSIFYKDVVDQSSEYIWTASDRTGAPTATAALITSATTTRAANLSFNAGKDIDGNESTCSLGDIYRAVDVFKSTEDYDISLVITGKSRGGADGSQSANYIIDNICETRKDCISFVSPDKDDVVNNFSDPVADVVSFRNSLRASSYAVMDSGYKYQYDKHNDVYRWIPLNGDIAGLCARTDNARDPWYSPAGFNRGGIKNIVKLAWNPKQAERDLMYAESVNPVVNFPGQGIVLHGDKTLLDKPSAFDRINVRRLFIVLEKAIATAAKFSLFEFNDEFTRASFINLVTPFLRDVKARRGCTDFLVVADETNNTSGVIDRNEFVGDIYIKPTRSINFIQLNFVAVRSGVEFSEIIGNI